MFCVVFIWGDLCGLLLLAMSGHSFHLGTKRIDKLWNTLLTMYIFFKHECAETGVYFWQGYGLPTAAAAVLAPACDVNKRHGTSMFAAI